MVRLLPGLANGDVHVGSANDPRRRVASHRLGPAVFTKPHLLATLKGHVAVATERNAREPGLYFKSGSGKAFAKKRFW